MQENNEKDYDLIIARLTKRIYHLEQEVIRLGGTAYVDNSVKIEPEHNKDSLEKVNNIETVKDNPESEYKEAAASRIETPKVVNPVQERVSVENKIGKNVMAIVASVLIFFSLILFGGIAFSIISDFAKAVIMYAISIAITVFGIINIPKKIRGAEVENGRFKYRTFYTSLAACGIGLIYISGLISYFTFQIFSLWFFALTLVVWIGITMLLGYRYSSIFVYICNIGLVISTLLVTFQFENCLLGFGIYTVCLFALYIINRSDSFNRDCFYYIQYPIMFIILSAVVNTGSVSYIIASLVLFCVFVSANILYKVAPSFVGTNVVTMILNIVAIIYIAAINYDNKVFIYISLFMLAGIAVLYRLRYHKKLSALSYTAYGIALGISLIMMIFTTPFTYIKWIPYALLIYVGFALKDRYLRIGGYIALLLSISVNSGVVIFWLMWALCAGMIAVSCLLSIIMDYSKIDKYFLTASAMLAIYSFCNKLELESWLIFVVFSLVSLFMNSKAYYLNYRTKEEEQESKIIGYIINGCMILYGYSAIGLSDITFEGYQVAIVSLVTLVLCCINVKRIFAMKLPEMVAGIYICLKYSVLIYTILNRMEAVSFIVSIVGILIAITCIVAGFKFRHKSFRLYGLVVSLISVAKLILFDIKYDSYILRPIGFFLAGVLCFAISFTYSKLEKNIK